MPTLAVLAGCAGPLSTLTPEGQSAADIAVLWWVMFWGAVALFALVFGLLALVYLRPETLRRVTPGQWIGWGGLAMPIPVLVLLVGAALVLGEAQKSGRLEPSARVEAFRYGWVATYPAIGGASTPGVLLIPAGEPVEIEVVSADVIHSLWIPALAGKIDAIPGRINRLRLNALKPGVYQGICAEYCGEGHDSMPLVVEARLPEEHRAALEALR